MTYNFTPISIEKYAKMIVQNNPSEKKENTIKLIELAIKDVKKGERCNCGNPIWVAGSIFTGYACFTCTTGEANASEDYEIKEVIEYNK